MARIRVLVVDDHEVVRTGLKATLEAEEDVEVVGEAASAREAMQVVSRLEPQVVLMDVRMEEMNGIEACRLIRSAYPQVRVVMFTSFGEEEAVMSSIMAGASGYLLKNVGRADLLKAIRSVASGLNLLDPTVTQKVMERLRDLTARQQALEVASLSQREVEVLELVARGLTNRAIAENTVRNHVSRILEKLGLSRRTELVIFSQRHGLLGEEKAQDESSAA
jgi:DNA-binding NarL/FixJ family response regulator